MSIYVEIPIRASLDTVWAHTQNPYLHQQWDLRFSLIEYLPREKETDPQRFRYSTRIGCGLKIDGEGESLGERNLPDGSSSSALKFGSNDTMSLIREGSGYWKYIPTEEGISFLTWYDYHTRFGALGALFDRIAFRPLMGWATAWSFDRLRLWIENGISPSQALRQTIVHIVARITLAAIFCYHGLVPKLLGPHFDEVQMIREAGVAPENICLVLNFLGAAELLLAACFLLFWRNQWPSIVCIGMMIVAGLAVATFSPQYLGAAFNPVSLNLAIACIAFIDLIVLPGLPTASRCRRHPTR